MKYASINYLFIKNTQNKMNIAAKHLDFEKPFNLCLKVN